MTNLLYSDMNLPSQANLEALTAVERVRVFRDANRIIGRKSL